MKKLILITGLLLATNVFALDESDKRAVKIFSNLYPEPTISSCVHGYVFLVATGAHPSGYSTVQVFERVGDQSLPMRCEIIGSGKNATASSVLREQLY